MTGFSMLKKDVKGGVHPFNVKMPSREIKAKEYLVAIVEEFNDGSVSVKPDVAAQREIAYSLEGSQVRNEIVEIEKLSFIQHHFMIVSPVGAMFKTNVCSGGGDALLSMQ